MIPKRCKNNVESAVVTTFLTVPTVTLTENTNVYDLVMASHIYVF